MIGFLIANATHGGRVAFGSLAENAVQLGRARGMTPEASMDTLLASLESHAAAIERARVEFGLVPSAPAATKPAAPVARIQTGETMSNLEAVNGRRQVVAAAATDILESAGRLTAAQSERIDSLYAELAELDRHAAAAINNGAGDALGRYYPKDHAPLSPKAVMNRFARHGEQGFTADELTTIRNTMSTTTGSQGGFAVPSLVAAEIFRAMKVYAPVRAAGGNVRTSTGAALPFPTSDGTAEVGERLAENATAAAQDPSFGTAAMSTSKYSSKVVAVPIELLRDAAIDMDAFLRARFGERIGRIQNQDFSTGTGSSQPNGIVNRASSGKVGTTGQTTSVIYDDIVDLLLSVDPAYRNSRAGWMMHDTTLKLVLKLKDSQNRPLLIPSAERLIAAQYAGDMGMMDAQTPAPAWALQGFPVWANNDMATPAANAKTILFGDLSRYITRDALDLMVIRLADSVYTNLGQVGFIAFARSGGNLVDTAAVKYYQHSAT